MIATRGEGIENTYVCWVDLHHTCKTLFELLERGILRDEEPDDHRRLVRISGYKLDLDGAMLGDRKWDCEVHELGVISTSREYIRAGDSIPDRG